MIKGPKSGRCQLHGDQERPRFDVNFSVCLLHAALPEVLLLASSVQGALAGIGRRPNVLEEQFLCKKVARLYNSSRCLFKLNLNEIEV